MSKPGSRQQKLPETDSLKASVNPSSSHQEVQPFSGYQGKAATVSQPNDKEPAGNGRQTWPRQGRSSQQTEQKTEGIATVDYRIYILESLLEVHP